MVTSIPRGQSALNFFVNAIFVPVATKQCNYHPVSKDLRAIITLWFWAAVWWRDITNICLVFSVFTSRQTFILASNRVVCVSSLYLPFRQVE
jgi:hypothetical protein